MPLGCWDFSIQRNNSVIWFRQYSNHLRGTFKFLFTPSVPWDQFPCKYTSVLSWFSLETLLPDCVYLWWPVNRLAKEQGPDLSLEQMDFFQQNLKPQVDDWLKWLWSFQQLSSCRTPWLVFPRCYRCHVSCSKNHKGLHHALTSTSFPVFFQILFSLYQSETEYLT